MRAAALVFLLLLTACHGRKGTTAGSTASNEEPADTATAFPTNFYKRYAGTVAGKPVVAQFCGYSGSIQGVYYYTGIGQSISLTPAGGDDAAAEPGVLVLQEFIESGATEGEAKSPSWHLRISGGKLSGEWRSGDGIKHYPIELAEDYEGATALDAYWLSDSAALLPGNPKSPVATATYGYLLPREGGEVSFLYNALKEQMAPTAARGEDVHSALRATMSAYFADYRKDVAPMVQEANADLESFAFSYTSDAALYVRYNADNWLVTESFSADYTGGAHGNYGSSFANIDLAGKRIWKLADIVADTAALRPPLNDAAIAFFNLKPGEGMEQRMLVDEVPPTDNVCVGPKGLSFVYNPYEIASYADGQVSLYIPYKKLLPVLTPAFRTRMRLSAAAGTAMLRRVLPGNRL